MEEDTPMADLRRVLDKLARLSGWLGEVDEWLESREGDPARRKPASHRKRLTFENLDAHVAAES